MRERSRPEPNQEEVGVGAYPAGVALFKKRTDPEDQRLRGMFSILEAVTVGNVLTAERLLWGWHTMLEMRTV